MEQEYYYNPQTNETFSKKAATQIAVPDGFGKVDKSVFDTYTNQGAKNVMQPLTLVDSSGNPLPNFTPIRSPGLPPQSTPPLPESQLRTLTDPSDFAQAQVGAAVRQPTLPQGGAVLPNLALQAVTPNQLQTTPGLAGTVAAATPTATPAPMIQGAAVPSATQVAQTTAPAANTCLLYTSPSPRDGLLSRMPSSA